MDKEIDFDVSFKEMQGRIGNFMGDAEIQARRVIGDEEYENIKAYNRASQSISIGLGTSKVKRAFSAARLVDAVSFLIFSIPALGLGWSIYCWVH